MGYIRAEEVLPLEIIETIQKYADGVNIYIPRREDKRIEWGMKNNTRSRLRIRNEEIYREYLQGVTVDELSIKEE